jgi:hypothetical protein
MFAKNIRRNSTARTTVAIVVVVAALIGALQIGISTASASGASHGIVTLGKTNEGGSGSSRGAATGIVDILAGPCAVAVSEAAYERLSARITLSKGAKVVAQWKIFGEQRIAWVEPVGVYSIRSNQPTMTKSVRVAITPSQVATVRLIPACK